MKPSSLSSYFHKSNILKSSRLVSKMMGIPTPAEIEQHSTTLLDLRSRWLHAMISTSASRSRQRKRGWRLGKFDNSRDLRASTVLRTYSLSLSILGCGFSMKLIQT